MKILAIDPGSSLSGYVIYETESKVVLSFGKIANRKMLEVIKEHKSICLIEKPDFVSMGAGKEVIDTIFWAGRMFQASSHCYEFGRNEVKRANNVKNDKDVIKLIKLHYNIKLSRDSWQAFLLILHYERI